MKIVKRLEKIFLIISAVIIFISCILSVFLDEGSGFAGLATLFASDILISVFLFVGVYFYFLDNKTLSRLGFAFLTAINSLVFVAALANLGGSSESISLIVGLIGAVAFLVAFILDVVSIILSIIKKNDAPMTKIDELNARLELLEKWQKLYESKIITQEEFEAKRKELLKIK